MENINTKLQVEDIFVVNTEEFYGLKSGKYKVVNIGKTSRGALFYDVTLDRKNAATIYTVYADDLDGELYEPTVEDLTSSLGLTFLNFKSVFKYDNNIMCEAKKINSQR